MTSIYIALLYCLSRNKSRVESTRGGVNMEGGARSARGAPRTRGGGLLCVPTLSPAGARPAGGRARGR